MGAAPLCAEPMAAEAPPQHVRRALLTEDLSDPLTVLLALREAGASLSSGDCASSSLDMMGLASGVPRRRLAGRRRLASADQMSGLSIHIVEPSARQCLGVGRWGVLFLSLIHI